MLDISASYSEASIRSVWFSSSRQAILLDICSASSVLRLAQRSALSRLRRRRTIRRSSLLSFASWRRPSLIARSLRSSMLFAVGGMTIGGSSLRPRLLAVEFEPNESNSSNSSAVVGVDGESKDVVCGSVAGKLAW